MAKNKRRRRQPSQRVELTLATLPQDMQVHVERMGLKSVDAYLAWCRRHDFAQRLNKSNREQARESLHAMRVSADEHVHGTDRVRNPVHVVRRLLAGARSGIPAEYRCVRSALSHGPRDAFLDSGRRKLLASVLARMVEVAPRLLEPDSVGLVVAIRIAEHWEDAIATPEGWRPASRNEDRSLLSLVRHLFAKYPAPACLERAWFDDTEQAAGYRRLHLHVAQGNNLRTAVLPIPYTKKMAHCFPEAPADLSVTEALRYGQVRGLGGDAALARAICATRLGRGFEHDEFWRTVIQFFVRFGLADVGKVTEIVDYIHEHRFGVQVFIDERGRQHEMPPQQPSLTMAGRTPDTMRRQVEAWHARLGRAGGRGNNVRWAPSGIPSYREIEKLSGKRGDRSGGVQKRLWFVRELCSSEELRHESQTMRHCVVSYSSQCARGATRIFSMRFEERDKLQTVLTIEVRSLAVVQARGRMNAAPSTKARAIMQRWAKAAGLEVRSYV